ncbi:hypothetical protein ACTFIW_009003 [Dictyostelium discoideum]
MGTQFQPQYHPKSLHSIYSIGNLKSNESILIHSAAGGIGISSLDLLKSKQHQGYIFLTVGSKDKEEYLIKKYGSLITIYSSRNKDYVKDIKNKLMELGVVEQHQQDIQLDYHLNLGATSSTGFVSRNNAIETMFKSTFSKLISPQLVISSLDLFIQNQDQYPNYCLSDFNFEVVPYQL